MNEDIEKKLEELARLVEEDADFLTRWKANIDEFFSSEIPTSDPDFEERSNSLLEEKFKYLYERKDVVAAEDNRTEFEEAEKLINASDDEKKAEYTAQLQALREKNKKNFESHKSIRQDIQKKYNAMEAIVSEKIEAALKDYSKRNAANAAVAKYFPQLKKKLNSIPDYTADTAAYNENFLNDYGKIKDLKNEFPPFERSALDYSLEKMIDFLGKEKKAAYKKQLQALRDEKDKAYDAYDQIDNSINNKYFNLGSAKSQLEFKFNNIFKASVDRFWTSDRKVDEQKSSDAYKAMRTAVNALVGEDGEAKTLKDPKAQKQLYRAAYDACSSYVKVKKSKFSQLSPNGSERLRAARDMMTAITALYPEFEKSVSKSKKVDSKKKIDLQELSNKYLGRSNKVFKEEIKAAKSRKKAREM